MNLSGADEQTPNSELNPAQNIVCRTIVSTPPLSTQCEYYTDLAAFCDHRPTIPTLHRVIAGGTSWVREASIPAFDSLMRHRGGSDPPTALLFPLVLAFGSCLATWGAA